VARIMLSKVMWMGRPKALVFGLVVMVAAAFAASLLVLAMTMKPAEAAFPGPSGAIAYTSDAGNVCTPAGCTDLDVWRIAPDGFGATQLTVSNGFDSEPAFSPEGTQIAFNSNRDDGDGTGDWDIYRMNAAGNGERLLTIGNNTVDDREPFWFSSETKIAFRRDETSTDSNIWVLGVDENGLPTGTEQRLTTNPAIDKMPAVSPNGKLIAFASNRDGDYEIYVMKANIPEGPTNVPRKLTNNTNTTNPDLVRDLNPDWSPDGKKIVFESSREKVPLTSTSRFDDEIFVMNADGTGQKNLTNNAGFSDIDPVFSPDGRKISFERSNPPGSFRDIFRMRADGTRKVNLTENFFVEANPSWQPMP
jgi:Tol biopolymer transport system component